MTTTRPTLDYETEPTTRAGLSLVSTYTILTPFVVAIETEAREALAAELAALREAAERWRKARDAWKANITEKDRKELIRAGDALERALAAREGGPDER